MDKAYNPDIIEQATYEVWEKNNYFSPNSNKNAFCIMLPPPNVTGTLHMGHGFQHTLMDILTRYHRMLGESTLWQPGTDHAGISTQLVVEKQLERQGINRKDLSREEFLKKVWEWKDKSGSQITAQMRRLGSSVDWSRERFTLDEGLSNAVQKVFIQLYQEGLIYRGTRLVNWDPELETAVSDLEVIATEEKGFLWHISYKIQDSDAFITVATTRPETLLGDVAVAVNPDDARYKNLIGKKVIVPLCNRLIPIIADNMVEKEFGSGCVKITPAHDFNDHEVAIRHQLQPINIFTKKAKLNKLVPKKYQGLDRFVARKQIIQDLEKLNLLQKIENHSSKIPRGEKSNVVIEPLLTEQWYVKMKPLAEPAIHAVKNGDIKFIPDTWNKTYFQWLENIEDWCISRQLWWGHRIPAWYDTLGNVYVGCNEAEIRKKYHIPNTLALKQDEDVLDTWFSSALWPFSTLGWPEKNPEFEKFYPTNVLITGFDIIFFWVARMIMMGLKFTNKIPFKEIIITGLIRDAEGQKMSKSKGNVLDPIDLIDGISLEKLLKKRTQHLLLDSVKAKIIKATSKEFPNGIHAYGTDALRFTYTALATTGRNIIFDIQRLEGYRNFCNKLWNAARFVCMNIQAFDRELQDGPFEFSIFDQWINSKLQRTIADTHHFLNIYRFDLLAQVLHEFVWQEYCDWYLEFTKTVINDHDSSAARKRGTHHTMLQILETILKLLHPIIPFITDKIFQIINEYNGETHSCLMLASFPMHDLKKVNSAAETDVEWLKTLIKNIRTLRSEMNLNPAKKINLLVKKSNKKINNQLSFFEKTLQQLAKIDKILYIGANDAMPPCSTLIVHDVEFFVPLKDIIDPSVETKRLSKELKKWQDEIEILNKKLIDPNFISKAPKDVIQKQQERMSNAKTNYNKIIEQLKTMELI